MPAGECGVKDQVGRAKSGGDGFIFAVFVDKGGRCWYNQIILGKAGICGNDVDSRLIFGMNVKRLPEWG